VIGRLRGELAEVGEEDCLIDVGGVGYIVRCGARTLSRLPAMGEEAVLHIETYTREDGTRLFGFLTREERSAFVLLQAIQGVGPKAAQAVLDVLPPGELAAAVARQDKAAVARANGVGPKLAQRIVVELKDKPIGGPSVAGFHAEVQAHVAPTGPSVTGEAMAALLGLGVAEAVGRRAVERAVERLGDEAELPAVIRAALQDLGR
jgi:holliday junction DNA helicase RuvA